MKTAKKVLIITGIVLAILGICIASVAITMVNGDFSRLSTSEPMEERKYSVNAGEISNITLKASNSDVIFLKSDDNQLHFRYYENDKLFFEINRNGNDLSVLNKTNYRWYDYIGIDFNFPKSFEIYVPDNADLSISVKTSNGKIDIKDISINGNVSAETSNGVVNISDTAAAGNFYTKSSNGKVFITNVSTKDLSAESSNGRIFLTNIKSEEKIYAKTSNGGIELSNIFFGQSARLESSNGSISGSINDSMNNFNITSRTSNGKNNLPESMAGGTKDLIVKTSNGKIDISFAGQG